MARQRKLTPERKEFINGLLTHYNPKDAKDVQGMLKDLLGDTLQGMLEAEMDDHLGYSKYDYKNKETTDSRNGFSKKTVTSSMGPITLDIPRDREGSFEPQIVKKNETDISSIEDQVLSIQFRGGGRGAGQSPAYQLKLCGPVVERLSCVSLGCDNANT